VGLDHPVDVGDGVGDEDAVPAGPGRQHLKLLGSAERVPVEEDDRSIVSRSQSRISANTSSVGGRRYSGPP